MLSTSSPLLYLEEVRARFIVGRISSYLSDFPTLRCHSCGPLHIVMNSGTNPTNLSLIALGTSVGCTRYISICLGASFLLLLQKSSCELSCCLGHRCHHVLMWPGRWNLFRHGQCWMVRRVTALSESVYTWTQLSQNRLVLCYQQMATGTVVLPFCHRLNVNYRFRNNGVRENVGAGTLLCLFESVCVCQRAIDYSQKSIAYIHPHNPSIRGFKQTAICVCVCDSLSEAWIHL